MSWRLAKSLTVLRAEVDAKYPNRDKRSDGTIGDRAHASRRSDHNPNSAGVVCAWDCTDHNGTLGMELAEHLRKLRDPRIKYVISEGRMFSSYPSGGYPPWTWRPYNGTNKHLTHTHVSVHGDYDSTRSWKFYSGVSATEEDVIKRGHKDQGAVAYWQRRLNQGFGLALKVDGDFGEKTEQAVKHAQHAVNFDETGVIDFTTGTYIQAMAHGVATHESKAG